MLRRLTSPRIMAMPQQLPASPSIMLDKHGEGYVLEEALTALCEAILTQQQYFSPYTIQQAKVIRSLLELIVEHQLTFESCDIIDDIVDKCFQLTKQRVSKKKTFTRTNANRKFSVGDDALKNIILKVRAMVFMKTYGYSSGMFHNFHSPVSSEYSGEASAHCTVGSF